MGFFFIQSIVWKLMSVQSIALFLMTLYKHWFIYYTLAVIICYELESQFWNCSLGNSKHLASFESVRLCLKLFTATWVDQYWSCMVPKPLHLTCWQFGRFSLDRVVWLVEPNIPSRDVFWSSPKNHALTQTPGFHYGLELIRLCI